MITTSHKPRKPIDAATLAALLPGLGHLYVGKIREGIVWIGASVALMIVAAVCLMLSPGRVGLICALCVIGVELIVMTVCMVQSWKLAKRCGSDYELKDYNRWYVYAVLLFVAGIGTIVGISFVLRERVVQAFVIPEGSMSPTIEPGQRVVARVGVFLDRDPERGEVVIFRALDDRRIFFIKRVVALAGDTVEWRGNGDILINGEPLARQREEGEEWEQNGERRYRVRTDGELRTGTSVVPAHHCFVLGDHRSNSRDSRDFGPVPYASLFAAPVAKGWKLQKIE